MQNRLIWVAGAFLVALAATLWVGLDSRAGSLPGLAVQADSGDQTSSGRERQGQPNQPAPLPPARWAWWRDADVQQHVGLTAEQVRRINDIYERRLAEVRPFMGEWRQQDDVLDQMGLERTASVEEFAVQAERVMSLYTRVLETRTVMLYRMKLEMTPEQYLKLQEVRDRRSSRGGRGNRSDR